MNATKLQLEAIEEKLKHELNLVKHQASSWWDLPSEQRHHICKIIAVWYFNELDLALRRHGLLTTSDIVESPGKEESMECPNLPDGEIDHDDSVEED